MPDYRLRVYQPGDLEAVAGIYHDAIALVQPALYSPEQTRAWSSFVEDRPAFREWIESSLILVAMDESGAPVGFGGILESRHISAIFTAPAHHRKGIATRILDALIRVAKENNTEELTTAASAYSRPLFEQFGFTLSEVETKIFRGVSFERYAMRRMV